MHPWAGMSNSKKYSIMFFQSASDLFCCGTDGHNAAKMGLKRANPEQIVHKTEKKKQPLCLPRGPFRCTLIRKRWKVMIGVFWEVRLWSAALRKTIIPPLNTGSVTQRPRKSSLWENECRGQLKVLLGVMKPPNTERHSLAERILCQLQVWEKWTGYCSHSLGFVDHHPKYTERKRQR